MKYFIEMLNKTFDFRGKTNRRDYWLAIMVYLLLSLCVGIIAIPFISDINVFMPVFTSLVGLYEVVLFLPTLSISFRRLHDAGYSGWFLCLVFIPILGWLAIIFVLCQPSSSTPKIRWVFPNQQAQNFSSGMPYAQNQTYEQTVEQAPEQTTEPTDAQTHNQADEQTTEQKPEKLVTLTDEYATEKSSTAQTDELQQDEPLIADSKTSAVEESANKKESTKSSKTTKSKTSENASTSNVNRRKQTKEATNASKPQTRSQKIKALQLARDNGEITEEEYRKEVLKILK